MYNSKVINKRDGFTLYGPKNCYDTNYHLIDKIDRLEYLIDIDDIYNSEEIEEMHVNGGISWSELNNLRDIGLLIEGSWKVNKI